MKIAPLQNSFRRFESSRSFHLILYGLILAALTYRLIACFLIPAETSDVFRNLGYGIHAFDDNFSLYRTRAENFFPELWCHIWRHLRFFYPPVTLVFFYLFYPLGLGIFWAKLALTMMELLCAWLFKKHVSLLAATLYFCAPVSLWYSSREGQFEALQTLFIILACLSVHKKKWLLAGFFFAFSIQVKHFGVLLFPWIAHEIWRAEPRDQLRRRLKESVLGAILGFLPFSGYYVQEPRLFFIAAQGNDMKSGFNPYAWNPFNAANFGWMPHWMVIWNAVFAGAILIVLLAAAIRAPRNGDSRFALLPLALFWLLIKSMGWVQFWYLIFAPAFCFCFPNRKRLIYILLVLHFFLEARSITMILDDPAGPRTVGLVHEQMLQCMFRGPRRYIPDQPR